MSSRTKPAARRGRAARGGEDADNAPLYLRVAQSLRNRINSGEWPGDTQLPIIKDLASEYGVALVTIRQALALLAADQLVFSQRGRGTFVRAAAKDLKSNAALHQAMDDRLVLPPNCTIRVIRRRIVDSLPPTLLPSDGRLHAKYRVIEKLHLVEGAPFAFMSIYVDDDIYRRFPPRSDEKSKILRLILDQGPLKLSRSTIQMALHFADDRLADVLECAVLSALVRIRTVRCGVNGSVVLATDAYYRGDKFLYEIQEENIELAGSSPVVFPDLKP